MFLEAELSLAWNTERALQTSGKRNEDWLDVIKIT